MFRKIFEPMRKEVTLRWRKSHKDELNDQHFSPNHIRMIKSRKMKGVGHAAHMGEKKSIKGFGRKT
jgi:hypothetical protein